GEEVDSRRLERGLLSRIVGEQLVPIHPFPPAEEMMAPPEIPGPFEKSGVEGQPVRFEAVSSPDGARGDASVLEPPMVDDRGGAPGDVLGIMGFRSVQAPGRNLGYPVGSRPESDSGRPRIDPPRIEVPPLVVRLRAVKAASLHPEAA